jgi:hypothetical protein
MCKYIVEFIFFYVIGTARSESYPEPNFRFFDKNSDNKRPAKLCVEAFP